MKIKDQFVHYSKLRCGQVVSENLEIMNYVKNLTLQNERKKFKTLNTPAKLNQRYCKEVWKCNNCKTL